MLGKPTEPFSPPAFTHMCNSFWVPVQSTRRVFGSQLVQLLLQKNPLNLQPGSNALRQCHLLATLLQCVPLAELVDSGQSQTGSVSGGRQHRGEGESLKQNWSKAVDKNTKQGLLLINQISQIVIYQQFSQHASLWQHRTGESDVKQQGDKEASSH